MIRKIEGEHSRASRLGALFLFASASHCAVAAIVCYNSDDFETVLTGAKWQR